MRLTSVNYSTPYLGNFFCEIDNYNLAFVAISKNAITYLQSIAIYAKTGYIMHSEHTIGSVAVHKAVSCLLMMLTNKHEAKKLSSSQFGEIR